MLSVAGVAPEGRFRAAGADEFGELAQLGERLVCTQEVTGSSPVFSTRSWQRRGGGSEVERLARCRADVLARERGRAFRLDTPAAAAL